MSDSGMELLLWARGPAFQGAVVIFLFGVALRLLEIFMLGRKPDYSEPRGGTWKPGLRMIGRRFFATPGMFKAAPVTHIAGHLFHFGMLIVVLGYIPHIEVFHTLFGLRWPGLPTPLVDAIAVITILALLVVLYTRLTNPVRRFLSTTQDYLVWGVTLLPLLTGYLAFHRIFFPYTTLLALHILSLELLLVLLPFTKLSHAFTLFIARWYNGAISGRKGVMP